MNRFGQFGAFQLRRRRDVQFIVHQIVMDVIEILSL
jgi:hypothetical protein